MRTLAAAGMAVMLAATGACASSGRSNPAPFYRPMVSLRDVRPSTVGIGGGTVELVLNVYNPNDYRLVAPRFTYRVLVDSVRVATGVYDADIVIPGDDSVKVRLPAQFTYASARAAGRSLLGSGSVNYRVVGDITVGTPYGRFRAPYDRAGWFSPLAVPIGAAGGRP
ncbi:MAG TPA: LEA type 2 family protein [Gemmatimonadaceae bacterium]|nr:LEA type 2 family protein [Gemmatimonadaceae bacterium]